MPLKSEILWDYTDRAADYDKRADYSYLAISKLVEHLGLQSGDMVADIGAGTGKLTVPLIQRGLSVMAVEPNDAMRSIGTSNTKGQTATWSAGSGERTGLPDQSVKAAFFGSSFNVVDPTKALAEVVRIVAPGGGFACMWNHRDIDDPLQASIEEAITSFISDYDYGARRRDPTPVLQESGVFSEIRHLEERFDVSFPRAEFIEGWRSHATLARQAGQKFEEVIEAIGALVPTSDTVTVPYTTRIWWSALADA